MGLFMQRIFEKKLIERVLIHSNMNLFLRLFKEILPVIDYICLSDQIKSERFKRQCKT